MLVFKYIYICQCVMLAAVSDNYLCMLSQHAIVDVFEVVALKPEQRCYFTISTSVVYLRKYFKLQVVFLCKLRQLQRTAHAINGGTMRFIVLRCRPAFYPMIKPIEMRLKTAYQPHITCAMPTKQVVSAFLEQKIVRMKSVKTVCAAKLLAH